MKNMQKVLDIINEVQGTSIEIYEEFSIGKYDDYVFRFTEDLLEWKLIDTLRWSYFSGLGKLLNGDLVIKENKKMWKPKDDEEYFIPSLTDIDGYGVNYWQNDDTYDPYYSSNRLIFKTQEEAIAMTDKLLEYVKELRKGE